MLQAWEGQRAVQVVDLWVASGLVHLHREKRLEQHVVVGLWQIPVVMKLHLVQMLLQVVVMLLQGTARVSRCFVMLSHRSLAYDLSLPMDQQKIERGTMID